MFAAAGVGIVGAFKGFWWGLLMAAAFWLILGPAAMSFNPTQFLRDPLDKRAHEEIIEWAKAQWQRQAKPGR